jgi:signal transduction histidine kinase
VGLARANGVAPKPRQAGLDMALDYLSASLNPQEVIARLMQRAVKALQADRASLVMLEDGGWCTAVGAVDRGGPALPIGTRWRITSKGFKRMIAEREPMLGGRFRPDELAEEARPHLADVRHTLTVPLFVADQPYAALSVSRRSDKAFEPEDVATLQEIGGVAALALRNARLYAEAQAAHELTVSTARRFRTGVDLALDLASDLDPGMVVRRMLKRAVEAVGADRGTLASVASDSIVVDDSYGVGGPDVPVGTTWLIADQPMLVEAIKKRHPVQVSRGRDDFPTSDLMQDVRHILLVPFVLQGDVVATLGVSRSTDPGFSEEDIATLQQIGSVAVLAIRNARLLYDAQEASRAKSDFLNLAAHELRTPLSVIKGYLSMLEDGTFGAPSDAWQAPIGIISHKAGELAGLVDSLLAAARIQAGALPTSARRVDLLENVNRAVKRAEAGAQLLDGKITVVAPPKAVKVRSDPEHIGRILDNLINNSLTYSGRRPEVRIEVRRTTSAVVRVTDNGLGIPDDLRERVFERFFRIDSSATLHSGTGLGLYIARELAKGLGGALVLESSAPGRGSTFKLTLPLS